MAGDCSGGPTGGATGATAALPRAPVTGKLGGLRATAVRSVVESGNGTEGLRMSLEAKPALHEGFWRGTLARPLLGFFCADLECEAAGGYPSVDIDLSPADVAAKYTALAAWKADEPGDRVPEVSLNYGTSFLPALAGAEYRQDGHTAWCLPTGLSAAELSVSAFDVGHPLWRSYEEKLRALLGAGIRDAVIGTGAMSGPVEMLLGLLGPEQLSVDMVDAPDAVARRIGECGRFWRQVFEAQWQTLGRPAGNVGFGVYMPGRSCLFTEDGLALVGPEHYERFYRAPIAATARGLDVAFIHTHSGGLHNCALLAQIDGLAGVELSNDPNGPALARVIETGVELQCAGKAVMFSNWQRRLSESQVDRLLGAADPSRTFITLTVGTVSEAEAIVREARGRFGGGGG
jgi:hypothetical protein